MARQKEEKLKHTANSYTPEFKTEVRDMLLKMVLENQHIAELCQGIWPTTMNSFSCAILFDGSALQILLESRYL